MDQTIRKHIGSYEFDMNFVDKVLDSFYVDDFSGEENDLDNPLELDKKLKLRFSEGLFYLRKWRANHTVLRTLISENKEIKLSQILGVIWDEDKDNFIFNFTKICEFSKTLYASKRNALKVLATFYDPIDILQLILINLKILFQQIFNNLEFFSLDGFSSSYFLDKG